MKKRHGYKGKCPTMKDRGPLCEALWNAKARAAALDHEINWISKLNGKDYWSYIDVEEINAFVEHFKKRKKNIYGRM